MAKSNYSSWIFLGAAILAGAGAFWLSHTYLKKQEEKLRTEAAGGKQSMVSVVVASKNLPAGAVVGPPTMSLGKLPKAYVSDRFVTPDHFDAVQGHTLIRGKAAGEPLLMDDVGGVFVERFSDLLKPGQRAVSLEATELDSNSGLLIPGDRVDLYLMVKDQSGSGNDQTKTLVPLLEDVHVLAAGTASLRAQDQKYQTLNDRNGRYSSITVAVGVEDAEKLVLARKIGDVAYLLRNSTDSARDVASRMSSTQLGVGGAVSAGGSEGESYEYFSARESTGVLRPIAALAPMATSAGQGALPDGLMTPDAVIKALSGAGAGNVGNAPTAPPPSALPESGAGQGAASTSKPTGE